MQVTAIQLIVARSPSRNLAQGRATLRKMELLVKKGGGKTALAAV